MQETARILRVSLQAIAYLKTLWAPILPHTSQQLHQALGFKGSMFGRQYTEIVKDSLGERTVLKYDHNEATQMWSPDELVTDQPLEEPKALFQKLDAKVVLAAETGAT
jgi:methionyl-tRNA synthetase